MADRIATWLTVRNKGIREPEMRLPTCIIAALLTLVGAVISGITYKYKTHWAGPIVGYGILSAGAQIGATIAISYSLDCHKELSAEIMVTISCLKSAIAWIWTWCINDWTLFSGVLPVFMILMAINFLIYGLAGVFYIYGKRTRLWLHNVDLLKSSSPA